MKILLDTCVWAGCIPELRAAGHDVQWVGEWEEDPGDTRILEFAKENDRVLVTLDKDFGEIAVVSGQRHSGIIRIVDGSVTSYGRRILLVVNRYADELTAGGIVTAEPTRVRVRPYS